MKNNYLQGAESKRKQGKQETKFSVSKKFENQFNNKKNYMIKNVRAVDSEAFKILSAINLVSGMNNPVLEFRQVEKGIFRSKNLQNIQLEITDESFRKKNGDIIEGSMMHIIDLMTNTKVVSRYLKSYNLMQKYNKKNTDKSIEYPIYDNLRLEDFQPRPVEPIIYDDVNLLIYYYLSADFKLSNGVYFRCSFSIEENKIHWKAESLYHGIAANKAEKKKIQKWLLNFKSEYFRLYRKNIDLNDNPYLNF